jgi:tRNA1Val (adenine37-N6)-methyltransferase
MDEVTLDEILDGRLRVFQKKRGYRFSVDAILLAHFIFPKSKSKAIDLGTGSGIIPLLSAVRFPQINWIGLEIQEQMAIMAEKSIGLNCLQDRIRIIHGDARKIRNIFPAHSFDVVTFNPPYRKIDSGRINSDPEKAIARHEIKGSLKHFLPAAKYLLKPRGQVFTIYPAKRLAGLIELFRVNSIEPKRMRLVFSDAESDAELVLVEGRAGSLEELKIESPIIIYGEDKKYSQQMNKIFNDLAVAANGDG